MFVCACVRVTTGLQHLTVASRIQRRSLAHTIINIAQDSPIRPNRNHTPAQSKISAHKTSVQQVAQYEFEVHTSTAIARVFLHTTIRAEQILNSQECRVCACVCCVCFSVRARVRVVYAPLARSSVYVCVCVLDCGWWQRVPSVLDKAHRNSVYAPVFTRLSCTTTTTAQCRSSGRSITRTRPCRRWTC